MWSNKIDGTWVSDTKSDILALEHPFPGFYISEINNLLKALSLCFLAHTHKSILSTYWNKSFN